MHLQLVGINQWWTELCRKDFGIQIFWHSGQPRRKPERRRLEWEKGFFVVIVLGFIWLGLLLFCFALYLRGGFHSSRS